jgi:hypothetical protein
MESSEGRARLRGVLIQFGPGLLGRERVLFPLDPVLLHRRRILFGLEQDSAGPEADPFDSKKGPFVLDVRLLGLERIRAELLGDPLEVKQPAFQSEEPLSQSKQARTRRRPCPLLSPI